MKTRQLRGAFAGAALQRNIRAWQPAGTALVVAAALAQMAAPAQAQQALAFDIPAQSLAGALRAFSQQARHCSSGLVSSVGLPSFLWQEQLIGAPSAAIQSAFVLLSNPRL